VNTTARRNTDGVLFLAPVAITDTLGKGSYITEDVMDILEGIENISTLTVINLRTEYVVQFDVHLGDVWKYGPCDIHEIHMYI